MRLEICLAILCVLYAGPAPAEEGSSLSWPLEIREGMSASFGEYRGSRLHMGVDFKTRGEVGHAVLAAADGQIFRLKVEYRGYGRALYIRHRDGRITVYAHLSRFENETLGLENRVRSAITGEGTYYPGNIFLRPPVEVRQGQVIAWSGESGMGFPHLHFEVREGESRAVAPFLNGLPLPEDSESPVFRWLKLYPSGPMSLINGERQACRIMLKGRNGEYKSSKVTAITGSFRISADCYDRIGADNWCGVARLGLEVDGRPIYDAEFDGARYNTPRFGGLVYDTSESHLGPSYFSYFLVPFTGNRLNRVSREASSLEFELGYHKAVLTARDDSGNVSRAEWRFVVNRPPVIDDVRIDEGLDRQIHIRVLAKDPDRFPVGGLRPLGLELYAFDEASPMGRPLVVTNAEKDGDWITCNAEASPVIGLKVSDSILSSSPHFISRRRDPVDKESVAIEGHEILAGSGFLEITLKPTGLPFLFREGVLNSGEGTTSPLRFICNGRFMPKALLPLPTAEGLAGKIRVPVPGRPDYRIPLEGIALGGNNGKATARLGALTVKANIQPGDVLQLRKDESVHLQRGLEAVGSPIRIAPDGLPFSGRFDLTWRVPAGSSKGGKLGIYSYDPAISVWWFEHSRRDKKRNVVTCRASKPGIYALAYDFSKPKIGSTFPGTDGLVETSGFRPTAEVIDIGMGIGDSHVRFLLDGMEIPVEYDPDRARARAREPMELAPGPHTLEVTARDRAWNQADPVAVRFRAIMLEDR